VALVFGPVAAFFKNAQRFYRFLIEPTSKLIDA
jgi:hypothetical protein